MPGSGGKGAGVPGLGVGCAWSMGACSGEGGGIPACTEADPPL